MPAPDLTNQGQCDPQFQPTLGPIRGTYGPAMQRHDLLRDRQAQSRAATTAIAGFVQPVEGLEHVIQGLRRHARSLVFHNDGRRRRVPRTQPDRTCVFESVYFRAFRTTFSTALRSRSRAPQMKQAVRLDQSHVRSMLAASKSASAAISYQQGSRSTASLAGRLLQTLQPRKCQQLRNQRIQPFHLALHPGSAVRDAGSARGEGPKPVQAGDGRPQFVRNIGDEPLLRLHQRFDPGRHLVEVPGQPSDLVMPLQQLGQGDARRQIAARERGKSERADRPWEA